VNREEAKQILLLYRPGTADAEDPQVEAAMKVACQDPELGRWFTQHAEFQKAMRSKLRQIEVPPHLKAGLLARNQIAFPSAWWRNPTVIWLAAAAMVVVMVVGLVALRNPRDRFDRFANFKERIVGEVQRQYVMDWETTDMSRLRKSIASRGGQSDYDIPKGLQKLKLTGGGVLKWQSHPVSMVCFDRGGGRMMFLFVMKRDAVKDPPPAQNPQLSIVHNYLTASWTRGDNSYVLAGQGEQDLQTFAKRYLD